MTAREFFDWVHRPENEARFFELDRGEVVELSRPGKYHGFVCANVSGILGTFAVKLRKGYVCTNGAGVVVEHDPEWITTVRLMFYKINRSPCNS